MSQSFRKALSLSAIAFVFLISIVSQANAGFIVQCGDSDTCVVPFTVQMSPEGSSMVVTSNGELLYNSTSGDISLNTAAESTDADGIQGNMLMWNMANGNQIRVTSLSGNADPILGFGVGATTGAIGGSFSFNFELPVAIDGTIQAESSLGYSLTALTGAGAQITTLGSDLLQAWEVDTSVLGLGSLNKGVDTGDTFGFLGAGTQTTSFGETNTFIGDLAYDKMVIELDFALSPNSIAGLTGFVEQTVIPVPAAAWLFGSALIGLGAIKRRS